MGRGYHTVEQATQKLRGRFADEERTGSPEFASPQWRRHRADTLSVAAQHIGLQVDSTVPLEALDRNG